VEITLLLTAGTENAPPRVYRTVAHVRADGIAPFETEVVPPADEGGGGSGGSGQPGGAGP
jgi:hypothetical protein